MKKIILKLILLPAFAFFAGCGSSAPSVENISEIALKVQTGMSGSDYTVSFLGEGAARCECTFYNLTENKKPNLDFIENICADLYLRNGAAFVEEKQSEGNVRLKGIFNGKITRQEFENLAQTVRQSGFFQLVEKESNKVILDAPPNFVKVIYEGKTKEISDANHNLSEIEDAVLKLARETNWSNK